MYATYPPLLAICNKRQERKVTGALDSNAQTALLALGKAGLFAGLDLPVHVYETLQRFDILIVKKRNVCFVLKNFSHAYDPSMLIALDSGSSPE